MTGVMRAGALRLLDGGAADLGRALRLEVEASLDSPARSFRGSFLLAAPPGKLGRVWVDYGGERLFEGQVDRQQVTVDRRGITLELEARSKGALLLDNEATPCSLTNIHLGGLFARVAAPYGFVLYNPRPAFTLGLYTVQKNTSQWEALCGFCRRAWGITPYVLGDQVIADLPRGMNTVVIGNGEGRDMLPYTSLEEVYLPYRIISRVYLRDSAGNYSAPVVNPSAAWHGVERQRYVIPVNEFVDVPTLDANGRIRKSMEESGEVTAVLPGIHPLPPGQPVEVRDEAVEIYNLRLRSILWRQDGEGVVSRLGLRGV